MKKYYSGFILIIIVFLFACSSSSTQNLITAPNSLRKETDSITKKNESASGEPLEIHIKLNHNFEIYAGKGEDLGDYIAYMSFRLNHRDKIIFVDTSLTEYQFADKLYPMINVIDSVTFEVLIEINDRPLKNYLKYFKIRNDSLIELKKLPAFIAKASNLDNDENLELAGFWGYSELWGENYELSAYNPIIYYEISDKGILIDSLLTIEKNKQIYWEFKGFYYNENKPVSHKKTNDKFEKEIKRIEDN